MRTHLERILPLSPYTRERFAGRQLDHWRDLEPIAKTEMMANFTRLNTLGIDRDKALEVALAAEDSRDFSPTIAGVTVGLSSGTSGHRGLFIVPASERADWAGHMLARMLPHPLIWPRQDRVAFFLRANSNLYESTRSLRVRFEYFDLMEDLPDQLGRLEGLAPTVIVAPPSTLRRLANRLLAGDSTLAPIRVISVAEVLDPIDERLIRRAFRTTVHQVYQATEGFLGSTCRFGTMHLAEDVVVVEREAVDAHRFVPVITDFRRLAQPMIRYRMGDVLRLRPVPCSCGSVLTALASIEGRNDDVFMGLSDGRERAVYADFLRRAVLTATPDVEDYGVRQTAPDRLELYVRPTAGADDAPVFDAVRRSLGDCFERLDCRAPEIRRVDTWPAGGMRKRKRVERTFDWEPH